jgi:O-methyltransferase
VATTGGIDSSDIRDLMIESVERRFGLRCPPACTLARAFGLEVRRNGEQMPRRFVGPRLRLHISPNSAAVHPLSKRDDPYLDLLKKCLTRYIFPDTYRPMHRPSRAGHWVAWSLYPVIATILRHKGLRLYRYANFDPAERAEGRDWPSEADTMIGLKRLDNLHACIEDVIRDQIPGDFIETGVWRGGACIFMRAALNVYEDRTRKVWVADSYEGLPRPNAHYPEDADDLHWTMSHTLAVSLEQVQANFSRYGLLDERVQFLKGWFKDTLPIAPIERLAILRLDGDMYSSTMQALVSLYPKLSTGGFVIIDDYGAVQACRKAVIDFREINNVNDPIRRIDWCGVYWRKGCRYANLQPDSA